MQAEAAQVLVGLEIQDSVGNKYRLKEPLGTGGHGSVWQAEVVTPQLGEPLQVAVKFLSADSDAQLQMRFALEGKIQTRLQHPHIMPVLASGVQVELGLFIVMPYRAGTADLARCIETAAETASIDEAGRLLCPILSTSEIVRIVQACVAALRASHAMGVIHRDLKPENVLLAGGDILVTDFGVAKAMGRTGLPQLTVTGVFVAVGTPGFIAPEVLLRGHLKRKPTDAGIVPDERADIFSLGALLYCCCVGRPPQIFQDADEMIARVAIGEELVHLRELLFSYNTVLVELVHQCLARFPDERPSLDEIDQRLGEALRWETRHPIQRPVSVILDQEPVVELTRRRIPVDSHATTLGATDVQAAAVRVTRPVPKRADVFSRPLFYCVALLVVGLVCFQWEQQVNRSTSDVSLSGSKSTYAPAKSVVSPGASVEIRQGIVPTVSSGPSVQSRQTVLGPETWAEQKDRKRYNDGLSVFKRKDYRSARLLLAAVAISHPEFPLPKLMVAECARAAYEQITDKQTSKEKVREKAGHLKSACVYYRAYEEASREFDVPALSAVQVQFLGSQCQSL